MPRQVGVNRELDSTIFAWFVCMRPRGVAVAHAVVMACAGVL